QCEGYLAKLKIVGIDECPYNLPEVIWQNNPTKWPDVQWPDVCNYLMETPEGVYTKESMKNFKTLEAHIFFLSGFVQTVEHMKVPNTTQQNRKKMTTLIIHGYLYLRMGVYLLLTATAWQVRNGYTKAASTDKPCLCYQCHTKGIQPAEVRSIIFYKDSVKQKLQSSQRKRKPPPPAPSLEKQKEFLQKLAGLKAKPVVL
ncbi:hypothetical protein MAR_023209, partial [Mya arenaria]